MILMKFSDKKMRFFLGFFCLKQVFNFRFLILSCTEFQWEFFSIFVKNVAFDSPSYFLKTSWKSRRDAHIGCINNWSHWDREYFPKSQSDKLGFHIPRMSCHAINNPIPRDSSSAPWDMEERFTNALIFPFIKIGCFFFFFLIQWDI